MPAFSIAIPVGKYDPRLEIALRSLEVQNVEKNIVLMDASDDARMRAIADQFDRLFYERIHGPDEGQADAIATGWEKAPGDILAWLNADDALLPGALQKVLSIFEQDSSASAVTGQSTILDAEGRFIGFHRTTEAVSDILFRSNVISQPSCFVKRGAVEAIGGIDRSLQFTMDWDLWVRLLESGVTFHHLMEPLSCVVMDDQTKTSTFSDQRRSELWRIVRRHHGIYTSLKTMFGFTLEHLRSSQLAGPVIRSVFSKMKPGIIGEDLIVPLLMLQQKKYETVMVHWEGGPPDNDVSFALEGTTCTARHGTKCSSLEIPAEYFSRLSLELAIRGMSGEDRIVSVECR